MCLVILTGMGVHILQDISLHCYTQNNVVDYGPKIKASVGMGPDSGLNYIYCEPFLLMKRYSMT